MEKEKADAYVRLVRTVKEKYTTGKCSKASGITGGKLQLFLRSTKSDIAFSIWR